MQNANENTAVSEHFTWFAGWLLHEVYRAHDIRLGRDVAIKVLTGPFASDPGWLARFEREARLLASLNHPQIAQIYRFEEFVASETANSHTPARSSWSW